MSFVACREACEWRTTLERDVALVAATHGDVLYTSDPIDMRRLLHVCTKRPPTIVRC